MNNYENNINRMLELENQVKQYLNPNIPNNNNNNNNNKQNQDLELVEKYKIRVCMILKDLHAKDYKKMACNFAVDELKEVLRLPLHARDRMYFNEQLSLLMKPENIIEKSEFRTAQDIVEGEKNINNDNIKERENKNKHSKNNK